MSLEPLCLDPSAWRVSLVSMKGKRILMQMEPVRPRVPCPVCGMESARIHSRYQRVAWDMAWGKWPVQLVVHTRRFFCDEEECLKRIFTEPFSGVLGRYGRQTARLKKALLELAQVRRRLEELPKEERRLVEGYRKGFYVDFMMREEMERVRSEQASAEERQLSHLDKALSYQGPGESAGPEAQPGLGGHGIQGAPGTAPPAGG